jgi:hypothetical protein
MATVPLDVFLPEIAPNVVGCPEPLIKNALVTAAREFCSRTLCWQVSLPKVELSDGDFPYSIPTPTDGDLARVLSVRTDYLNLSPTTVSMLDNIVNWEEHFGAPGLFYITPTGKLVLYPRLSEPIEIRVTAAYTVSFDAAQLEDLLFNYWRDAIVSGTLKYLQAMPNKGWSNPDHAMIHGSRFENGMKMCAAEVLRGAHMMSGTVVQMRPAV